MSELHRRTCSPTAASYAWAASVEDLGGEDGPQDALRHAFWQCTMVKEFDGLTAALWGAGHEKYNIDMDRGRMDLHNNAAGRQLARTHRSCAEGALWAKDHLKLILWKGPPPSRLYYNTQPPPPPPTFDQ